MAGVKATVGKNIARLIEATPGMTQADLARAIGRTPASVTHYTKGDTLPEAEILEKIALIFGVEVYELFIPDMSLPAKPVAAAPEISPEEALRVIAKQMGFTVRRSKKLGKDPH